MIDKRFFDLKKTLDIVGKLKRNDAHIYFFERLRDSENMYYQQIYYSLEIEFASENLIADLKLMTPEKMVVVFGTFNRTAAAIAKKYNLEFAKSIKTFNQVVNYASTDKGKKYAEKRQNFNKRRNLRKN